jgi:hypothetical protein
MGVSHRSIVGDSNQDYNPSSELELTPRSFAIAKIIKSQDRQEGMQAYNTQKSYRKRSSRKLINHVPVIPFNCYLCFGFAKNLSEKGPET